MTEIPFALNYPYTAAEEWAAASAIDARRGFSLLRYSLWVVAAAIPVALLLILLQGGMNLRAERLVPISLAGGVLFVLIYGALEGRIHGLLYGRSSVANQTMRVAFDETGVQWSFAGASVSVEWRLVEACSVTPEHLVLVFREMQGLAVPRRACATPEAFRSLLVFVKERVCA